jgi:hypothetical protein
VKKVFVFLSVVTVLLSLSLSAAPKFKIKQLQGAWWSDLKNPTADFGIQGEQVWLDSDSGYHSCKIEGDILIFELGPEIDPVKNRIISVKGNHMVLESLTTKEKRSLTRVALAATPLQASEEWFLLARHGECAKVEILKRKIPDLGEISDPHEFAALMRRSGYKVTITRNPLPKGKAYEVLVPEKELSLMFVTKELCNGSDAR